MFPDFQRENSSSFLNTGQYTFDYGLVNVFGSNSILTKFQPFSQQFVIFRPFSYHFLEYFNVFCLKCFFRDVHGVRYTVLFSYELIFPDLGNFCSLRYLIFFSRYFSDVADFDFFMNYFHELFISLPGGKNDKVQSESLHDFLIPDVFFWIF